MYGRIPERKLNEADYRLSCEEARRELENYIEDESRRVNIDSAKKKAVMQHMDYDGFRQMVLGANIMPTKSKELQKVTQGGLIQDQAIQASKSSHIPTNNLNKGLDLVNNTNVPVQTFTHQYLSSEDHCHSFRELKKKMAQFTGTDCHERCYQLIKMQNEERCRAIFSHDVDPKVYSRLMEALSQVLARLETQIQAHKAQSQESKNQMANKQSIRDPQALHEVQFIQRFIQLVHPMIKAQNIEELMTKREKAFPQGVRTVLAKILG